MRRLSAACSTPRILVRELLALALTIKPHEVVDPPVCHDDAWNLRRDLPHDASTTLPRRDVGDVVDTKMPLKAESFQGLMLVAGARFEQTTFRL